MDPLALKAELQTDPAALGYAPHLATGSFSPVVALINAPKAGVVMYRGVLPAYAVLDVMDEAEYTGLTADKKKLCDLLLSVGQVNTDSATTRARFASIFPAGPTRTALLALAQRVGSRAEELFGQGTVVSADDIALALRS